MPPPGILTVATTEESISYGIVGMSYEFDLSKSGSQWKISHGRNFSYFGALCKFSNPQLKIS